MLVPDQSEEEDVTVLCDDDGYQSSDPIISILYEWQIACFFSPLYDILFLYSLMIREYLRIVQFFSRTRLAGTRINARRGATQSDTHIIGLLWGFTVDSLPNLKPLETALTMSGLTSIRRQVTLVRPVGIAYRRAIIDRCRGEIDYHLVAASIRQSASSSSCVGISRRALSSSFNNNGTADNNSSPASSSSKSKPQKEDHWDEKKVTGYFGHNFPDFIEKWNRQRFRHVGYGLVASTSALAIGSAFIFELPIAPTLFMGALTTAYWTIGINDVSQTSHAVRRNYPVIGNLRYVMETIRPEIRQYLVEADTEGKPLDRMTRSLVYQRAKNVDDTLAFGTRRDVYAPRYEWACHSMFPKPLIPPDDATTWNSEQPRRRVWVGTSEFGTTKPHSASLLNVSAMSYGAISDNAILALSAGAKMGHFYHVSVIYQFLLHRFTFSSHSYSLSLVRITYHSLLNNHRRILAREASPCRTEKEEGIWCGMLALDILDAVSHCQMASAFLMLNCFKRQFMRILQSA